MDLHCGEGLEPLRLHFADSFESDRLVAVRGLSMNIRHCELDGNGVHSASLAGLLEVVCTPKYKPRERQRGPCLRQLKSHRRAFLRLL